MARLALPPHDPNLGPRLERFRATLAAAGGPVEALDQGRTGLDVVWRWVVESAPREPGRLDDEATLLQGGPLPAWYPRLDFIARSLGPHLLQLTDGLAAHVTSLLIADEPDADWIIEKDEYIKGQVPMLRLPGRRAGPVDEEIAGFVYRARMAFEPAFYVPSDPMTFVDAFLEFGDPRPRSYSGQTAKEARDLLDLVTSGHDARVARFRDAVADRGGPSAKLDFSRDSLVPVWTWLTSLPLPASPVPDREMRLSGPPWWYSFSGIMIGQALGPDLCWLATWAADYAAEVVLRLAPGSTWVLGAERRGADFREPLLRVGPIHTIAIHDRVPRQMAHDVVARMPHMAGQRRNPIGPNDLRDMIDLHLEYARQPAPTEAEMEPEPTYVVDFASSRPASFLSRVRVRLGRRDDPGDEYSATVSFSDEVAHGETRRVDRFVHKLTGHAGVNRAFREDRELVYVIAPGLTSEELAGIIARCWADAANHRKSPGPG